jgi:hypothetical protein
MIQWKEAKLKCLVKNIALITILTALAARPGFAQNSSHEKAAENLLRVMRIEESSMAGASAMVNTMIQSNPVLGPYREVVLKWAKEVMNWESMAPALVELYANTFSEKELEEMTAFYSTATGQKVLDRMSDLMNKQAMIGGKLAQEHSGELKKMIAEHAKEIEAKMK